MEVTPNPLAPYIDHSKGNVMESLNIPQSRMDEIVESARKQMMKDSPQGSKSQQLESMVAQCKNVNEVIAASIVWVAITNQMDNRQIYNEHKLEQEKNAFAEKIMSANPSIMKGGKA